MASLRNKQITDVKTSIGMLMKGSGTSSDGINTLANLGISVTYQTIFNKLKQIEINHEQTVRNYFQKNVNIIYNSFNFLFN